MDFRAKIGLEAQLAQLLAVLLQVVVPVAEIPVLPFLELFRRKGFEVFKGPFHTLNALHPGFPVKDFPGLGNIRLSLHGIVLRERFEDNFLVRPRKADNFLRKFKNGDFLRVPNVYRQAII